MHIMLTENSIPTSRPDKMILLISYPKYSVPAMLPLTIYRLVEHAIMTAIAYGLNVEKN